jgi:multiple sugar transport system permease protein
MSITEKGGAVYGQTKRFFPDAKRRPDPQGRGKDDFIYAAVALGFGGAFSVLLDGSDLAEKLQRLYVRNHSKILHPLPTLENYAYAFSAVPLGQYFVNTLIFTVATTALMLVVITLAAFAFARLDFKGKNLVFTLFLALMMIPGELVIITNFVTITELNLRNSFTGLILPSVTSVFYIYLLKESFSQVPDELYYAAKVDGTSDLKYLMRVMVPICRPTLVTVIILKVIECWNSYVWPRLITDDQAYFLVSNGIQAIRESGFGRENIPAMMAAVVAISLPLIALFLIFRKKVMAGVLRGGTKG